MTTPLELRNARPTRTLADIERAIRAAFAPDTCSPDDLAMWSSENPSRGHCVVGALTVNDFFGGDLLCAEVFVDDVHTGYHWWNRLHGIDIDLTIDQMMPTERVGEPTVVTRPTEGDHRYREQYELFRARVEQHLAPAPADGLG